MGENNNANTNYGPKSAFKVMEGGAKSSGVPASKRPQIIVAFAGRTTPRAEGRGTYYFCTFWTLIM
jgi:hypothetical protein